MLRFLKRNNNNMTENVLSIAPPYLLFIGDVQDQLAAKTAAGILQWRPQWCIGQSRLPGCKADLGLREMTPKEAAAAGVRTMVIGAANSGGILAENWITSILEAIEAGLDVASGLHMRLNDIAPIREAARAAGRNLFDVRHPTQRFATGKGARRSGKRLLTVGTDCSVGKMYTSLAIERALKEKGIKADFRATGQTGILIAGSGVSVDAVVADFISGAVEAIAPANDEDHWDIIEGQGSLFHPAFAGVTMGLIHGAQPDALVLCHEPTRKTMRAVDYPLPDIEECIDLNLRVARRTNPDARMIAVSVNCSALSPEEGRRLLDNLAQRTGLPCVDPLRDGVEAIVDRMPGL